MANTQLGDTEQMSFAITELDGDSNPTAGSPGDVVTVVSSVPASAIVAMDSTPAAGSVASGNILGTAVLATGVQITATVTHADGTTLSATALVDIVGGTASSLSIGFSAPVAQTAAKPKK